MDKIRKSPISYSSGKPIRKRGRKPGAIRTSKANAKRSANGLNPPKSVPHAIGAYAKQVMEKAPLVAGEPLRMAATAIAMMPSIKNPVISAFQSQEQRLVAKLRQRLISATPGAAEYLECLVDGTGPGFDTAPHAVRTQAALGLIDRAIQFTQDSPEIKDLQQMAVSDLEASLQSLGRELASRTAEDVEVIDDQNQG